MFGKYDLVDPTDRPMLNNNHTAVVFRSCVSTPHKVVHEDLYGHLVCSDIDIAV